MKANERTAVTFLVSLMALCLFCQPLAAAPKNNVIRSLKVGGIPYFVMDDIAHFYGFAKRQNAKEHTYYSRYSTLELTQDSRFATLNGTQIGLAFAPALSAYKTLLLSQSDFYNYLEPILRPRRLPRKLVSRIVIDPGHGGKDPGCRGGTVQEKQVTLAVGLKLAKTLRAKGYTVAMTRMNDKGLTLGQRTALSTKFKPDLFISLHCNAAAPAASGLEVYCATPRYTPSFGNRELFKKACKGNAHNAHNAYISYYTQKELVKALKLPDRGVKHKRYNVIANIDAPAMLVEMGFLTNPGDRKTVTSPANQQKIADAIARAVNTFKAATAPLPKK